MAEGKNKRGIGWKLLTYLVAFSAALLLILWIFQIIFMQNFYRYVRVNEAREIAGNIAKNIDQDLNELVRYMNDESVKNDVNIAIANKNSDLLAFSTSSPGKEMLTSIGLMRQYLQALNGETAGEFYTEATNGNNNGEKMDSIVYIKSAKDKYIVVLSALRPINATEKTIKRQFGYIAIIMILLSVMMAWLLSRKISDPLRELNKDAGEFARGNYDVKSNAGGYREVSELSATLNYAGQELGKLETYRRELMANVSHDLRTPLTLIEGYAEAMRDIPSEMSPENAQIIIDESKRLTSLVNDVIEFSKVSDLKNNMKKEEFNLSETVRKETERVSNLVRKENFNIVSEIDHGLMAIGDEARIRTVLYNLLINAVNYSEDDKNITVLLKKSQDGKKARFAVRDHGPGISKDELNLIWERYYKSKSNHKRALTGSGMGLSIVKSIITGHNGTYGVESEPGKGSEFWFQIDTVN